ncbi:MAG: cyclic nucleotide-binding domain-containing protein [Anaerolineae bacterium]|nr:cyclic nucleotide-binding domain-containing protein [Anaerolineae bacterium]
MDLIERLRRIPLFSQLEEEYLRKVAELCEARVVQPGQELCRQAERGSTLFIIAEGEAVIHRVDEQGLRRPVGMVRAGDYFGVTSLFLGEPRDATVTAVTEMRIWTLRRPAFQELLSEYPEIRRRLLIPEEIILKLRAPRYPWLEPGELVVHHCRRHWIVLLRSIAFVTLVVLGYLILLFVLRRFSPTPPRLSYFLLPVLPLYGIAFLWRWYDWRNDYFVVTTQRISHRERVAFLYDSQEEVPLDRVQNINVVRGLLGQLLDYGDLTIETAAEMGTMLFDHIPHPEEMRQAVWNQLSRAQATARATQRHLIKQALRQHIEPGTEAEQPPERAVEEPVDLEEGENAQPQPRALTRFLLWLAERDLVPRTRIQTSEAVTWRKHWIFLIRDILWPLGLSVVLGILSVLGFWGFPPAIISRVPFYPYIALFFTVLSIGWLWWQFNDWGNDLYIVTNERIIDVEKRPLFFSEQRREASLGMIQNISLEVPDILASLFNYGNVVVQTAGAGEFTFDGVPNPHEVQQEIFRRMVAYREAQRQREAARRRAELAEWFGVYREFEEERKKRAEGSSGALGVPKQGEP